jgi:hypothetical protein
LCDLVTGADPAGRKYSQRNQLGLVPDFVLLDGEQLGASPSS